MTELKNKLDAAKTAYTQSVSAVGKNDDASKALKTTVDELTQKYKHAETAVVKNESSIQGYTIQVNRATTKLKDMEAELIRVNNARLEKLADTLDNVGTKMESTGKKMLLLSAAVVAGAAASSKAAIDFEAAFAGVEKTVDATNQQLKKMSADIRQMALDIPATTNEISSVAEAAGQLGIAANNIIKFSKVMIDLGETTNLTADDAASSLAKLANLTEMSADNYGNLGSAIVALGNNGASTEADIVRMATKMASTGELVGLTVPQMLALASAVSSLGVEADAGGTAMSKLLKEFEVLTQTGAENLTDFAKIAGMSAKEFTDVWTKDPIEAVSAFVTGLRALDDAGGSSVATLEALGITERRMSNAILALAASGGILTKSVRTANTAWEENTALQIEAEKRYATTASQLQIAKNTINDVAITIGEDFLPMINNAVDGVKDFGDWISKLDDDQMENLVRILAITAALGTMVLITGKMVTVVGGVVTAIKAYNTAAAAGAVATKAFGAAMSATPVGAIATAIAILGSVIIGSLVASAVSGKDAIDELNDSLEDLEDTYTSTIASINESADAELSNVAATKELITTLDKLNSQVNKTSAEEDELAIYAEQINKLFGEQVYALDETTGAYESAVGSVDDYISALENQIKQQLIMDELTTEITKRNSAQDVLEVAKPQLEAVTEELEKLNAKALELAENGLIGANAAKLATQMRPLQVEIERLTVIVNESQAAFDESDAAINGYKDQIEETAETTDSSSKTIDENTSTINDNVEALEKQTESAKSLSKEVDELNGVLAEQEKNGRLSVSTILDLVDAGYAAALQINSETGAVTINRAAYIALAQAKIDEQIAAVQIDRDALQRQLDNERSAVEYLSFANYNLAASYWENLAAVEKNVAGYDATIAALKASRDSIGKYSASVSTGAGTVRSATKNISDAFKDAVAEIDYQLEISVISEEEYWKQYAELMSKYLKEGTDDWKAANAKLYKHTLDSYEDLQEAADTAYENGETSLDEYLEESARLRDEYLTDNDDAWSTAIEETFDKISEIEGDRLQGIADKYNEARNAILDDQSDLASKLSGLSNLTATTKDAAGNEVTSLTNLGDTLKTIKEYSSKMAELKTKGVSPSLLAYILKMLPDDAIAAADLLLRLSESQWTKEMAQWEEIQSLSMETAALLYTDQLQELDDALLDNVSGFTDDMAAAGVELGTNTVDGIVQGIKDGTIDIQSAMTNIINAGLAAANAAAGIASPSTKGIAIGKNIGQSIGSGTTNAIDGSTKDVQESVNNMLANAAGRAKTLRFDAVTALSAITGQVSGSPMQNYSAGGGGASETDYSYFADVLASRMSTAMAGMQDGNYGKGDLINIIKFGDAVEFYRQTIKDFRMVNDASPEVEADY